MLRQKILSKVHHFGFRAYRSTRLGIDCMDIGDKLISPDDLIFHFRLSISGIENRFGIGKHHNRAVIFVKILFKEGFGKRVPFFSQAHLFDELKVPQVLCDRGVDAFSLLMVENTGEFSSMVDFDIPIEVLAFYDKKALACDNEKIYLSRKTVMLEVKVTQHTHMDM